MRASPRDVGPRVTPAAHTATGSICVAVVDDVRFVHERVAHVEAGVEDGVVVILARRELLSDTHHGARHGAVVDVLGDRPAVAGRRA